MGANEKLLPSLVPPQRQCLPVMSELVAGGEILDALSVLEDIPDYLSDILNGHDGMDTASTWPSSHTSISSADHSTAACSCHLQTAVTAMGAGHREGGWHMATCLQHNRLSAAGMAPKCVALDTERTHHQHSLGPSLPPLLLYPGTTAHNQHHNSSGQDRGGQSSMETDHTAMYSADLSYYWSGGSDSCSPGHTTPDTYPNPALPTPGHLTDFTKTPYIKQEIPKLCGYSTKVPAYMEINSSFSKDGNVIGHHYHQLQPNPALPAATTQVVTSYMDPSSPQSAASSMDSSGGEEENTATDGDTSPRPEDYVKVPGIKSDRRLRRREQNRQAARRCRQRKKEQSQELVKEYYQLLTANSEMQSKLKSLETEKQRLMDVYEKHLVRCSAHLANTTSCK